MVKGAAKSVLGGTREENFVGGVEALRGVEHGVVGAIGRVSVIGDGLGKGLREVEELGEVEGWVGTAGGKGKRERVVGMILRVCNAGNKDEDVERLVEGGDVEVLVSENGSVASVPRERFDPPPQTLQRRPARPDETGPNSSSNTSLQVGVVPNLRGSSNAPADYLVPGSFHRSPSLADRRRYHH